MHSQFIRKFVNIIYRQIFIKYIFVLSFIVILKKINLFSNYPKSSFENYINYFRRYYLFL